MSWSSLPLIEMDEVPIRRENTGRRDEDRSQRQTSGGSIENDIGKTLSAFREHSRTSSRRDEQEERRIDEFGQDTHRNSSRDQGEGYVSQDQGNFRRRERSRSPRRTWDDEDRSRDRSRRDDWGRDEPRRRRDGYHSDGSNDSWETRGNGDRYRDWPRGRESDRYRDRRDYDYREREERDWRRDRWEGRDDDRRRDYREPRERYRDDDERSWSERDQGRDRRNEDYRRHDDHRRAYHEEPSEIVMLKGLPTTIEDSQIHEILADAKLPYKDVRVVKTREGYSRGFAFVEFLDMETAKQWVDDCKGKLMIEDFSVLMDFSRSKMAVESHRDWVCSKCGTQNFSSKRRNTCFTCNAPKDENDETKELGHAPCKVLILRALDVLTTEETIRQSLASFTATPIFDVRLIKDKLTGTSRGFCFVELGSIEEATQLMEELQAASFKIDEKQVVVSYAKFGTNPSKSGIVTADTSSSSASTSVSDTSTTSSSANKSRSSFAANAIAQARAAAQMGHTTDQTTSGSMEHYSTAEAATTDVVQDPSATSDDPSNPSSTSTSEKPAETSNQQTTVSSYVYDAATGFYYDTTTGLHYDPNTQYYYNSTTQQYMYWDATTKQYVTVISSNTSASTAASATQSSIEENTLTNKEKQKKAKSLNAKKIAKDMERWAKKQAKNKDAARPQSAQTAQDAVKESTYQYDPNDLKGAGIKMSITGTSNMASVALTSSSPLAALSELDDSTADVPTPASAASSLVAEYGGDDSGGEDDTKEDNVTDWNKLACLLCKRQFPSKETLTRHNNLSDLHKQNLLVQKKLKMSFSEIDSYEREQREAKYRDRARERRELFGQPDSTLSAGSGKRRKKGKLTYEQPTKHGITSENIGNKMLQAMGWTAGTGLGRDRQGIVDPILAKMRNRTAGLGLKGSDYGATAGDSERDLLKKMAQSRYEDS